MRLGIVEGEPGIFPDPVARLLRRLAGLLRRRRPPTPAEDQRDDKPGEAPPDG